MRFMESGGFSNLYLGRDLRSNRRVVIKIFQNDKFDDFKEEERYLRREKAFINIQSKFNPIGLKLIDSIVDLDDEDDPKFILVTNYIKGQDFKPWFEDLIERKDGDIYHYMIRYIFLPLAEYFASCHSHGLLHRDFSPSNVIISKKKNRYIPVVIDFGDSMNFDPAKLYDEPPLLEELADSEEDYIYTHGYSPPEVDDNKEFLPQSDIYAFGVVMFYAFSLGYERDDDDDYDEDYDEYDDSDDDDDDDDDYDEDYDEYGDDASESANAADFQEYVLIPKEYNEDCPDDINEIVEKCTQEEPIDRYLSFDHLIVELRKYLKKYRESRRKSKKKS